MDDVSIKDHHIKLLKSGTILKTMNLLIRFQLSRTDGLLDFRNINIGVRVG